MPQYTVVQGDTLSKIAKTNKLANWRKIYDHPDNREFREKRPDPNLIFPGDELFVPEQEKKHVIANTKKKNKHRLKSQGTKLTVVLLDGNKNPLSEIDYTFDAGNGAKNGKTDKKGKLSHRIPADAETVKLTYEGRTVDLKVGQLDPISETEGVQARLQNLGYKVETIDGDKESEEYKDAVKAFQREYDCAVDGIVGSETRGKLKKVYGC